MDEVASLSLDLIESYKIVEAAEKEKLVEEFLDQRLGTEVEIDVEFPSDLEWFNIKEAITLRDDVDDKLVILDFFTYCCINCLHILPSLHQLEEEHSVEDGLVIVGVHSAKFENERVSANIAAALSRYDIRHPVVNDAQLQLWNQLGIACWPTLLVLGPGRQPLLQLVGEGHTELLRAFTAAALRRLSAAGRLGRGSLPLAPAARLSAAGPLRFPGKLCRLDERRLVISDTGHHRLLVTDNGGTVLRIVGGPSAGFADGRLGESKFNSPQGVAVDGDVIYVADTENHAVRKVDLQADRVETVAGTGSQGEDREGGAAGPSQPLSSPWDLWVLGDQLYIAMAGQHQIWTLFLRDGTLFGKRPVSAGTCLRLAGSGEEANRNNSYPHRAAFAQPSGLSADPESGRLWVADSESSSIRQVALADGAVKAVVGGAKDPTNLFEYGDADSAIAGGAVLLQHPLGVAWSAKDSALYVADTYNHKLKRVTQEGKKFSCVTVSGGERGDEVGPIADARFNEPGGLMVDSSGDVLLVADTNNHCIKRVDLTTGAVERLAVQMARDSPDRAVPPTAAEASVSVRSAGGDISVRLELLLTDVSLTDGAPHSWKLDQLPTGWTAPSTSGSVPPGPLSLQVTAPSLQAGQVTLLSLQLRLFLCSPAGMCFPRSARCEVRVEGDPTAQRGAEARLVVKLDSKQPGV
ncbi:NHL repeat-containing protein 2-like [Amphibalanus amphitrite]|uniref:NHL repeat-containing protein 2-like n=1 Tax=Amphibalanus amphitrite TaxID=1232801 RepID=UPI001C90F243|nr:NHL repeat-containing protein 2-like [Amphibalanus amphitrite]